jgi:hypothetical protein
MLDALRKNPSQTAHIRQIKSWVENHPFAMGCSILVTELKCTEPGCPPIETVIALLPDPKSGTKKRQFKIHKTISGVTEEEVVRALSEQDGHDHRHDEQV